METSSSRFMPAEGGARLATMASVRNTMVVEYSSFISTRLLHEEAYKIRGCFSEGRQRSVYVTLPSRVRFVAYELTILTDLTTASAEKYEDVNDWIAEVETKEVVVCTSPVLMKLLQDAVFSMDRVNVLVIDSCHRIYYDKCLEFIMKVYKECNDENKPRILALTYPLFGWNKKQIKNAESDSDDVTDASAIDNPPIGWTKTQSNEEKTEGTDIDELVSKYRMLTPTREKEKDIGVYVNKDDFYMYESLEYKIETFEYDLCCQMDLAEDIDGGKRLSATPAKPKELIIEYARPPREELSEAFLDLDNFMRITVREVLKFINEHRHDPTEIYGEELYEEFMNIPDPTLDPKVIFKQFLYILDELGPYAADKAAYTLLNTLEKMKIKIPYERHFLLLCLCTTVLVKIRCYADIVFSKYTEWQKIEVFSTPKVMRFVEILQKFHPPDDKEIKVEIGSKSIADTNTHNLTVNNEHSAANNRVDNGKNETKDAKQLIVSDDRNDNKIHTTNEFDNVTEKRQEMDVKKDILKRNCKSKMLDDLDKCDFNALCNKLEDTVNTYEANLKDIGDIDMNKSDVCNGETNKSETDKCDSANDSPKISDDSVHCSKSASDSTINGTETRDGDADTSVAQDISTSDYSRYLQERNGLTFTPSSPLRACGRPRRGRAPRRPAQPPPRADALCGIVYVQEPLMAKIMFMLVADMCRHGQGLRHVSAQYCCSEGTLEAPGLCAPGDCQRRGRKQEDVLKKFRMHECNLLMATSSLEEGIDLPRCNLVLRWDMPLNYRSFGLCRGRARAPRAAAALLSPAPETPNPDEPPSHAEIVSNCFDEHTNLADPPIPTDTSNTTELPNPAEPPNTTELPNTTEPPNPTEPPNTTEPPNPTEPPIPTEPPSSAELIIPTDPCSFFTPSPFQSTSTYPPRSYPSDPHSTDALLHNVATYRELDQMITRKCGCGIQDEPPRSEEEHADNFTPLIKPYTPNDDKHNAKDDHNDSRKKKDGKARPVSKEKDSREDKVESNSDIKKEENDLSTSDIVESDDQKQSGDKIESKTSSVSKLIAKEVNVLNESSNIKTEAVNEENCVKSSTDIKTEDIVNNKDIDDKIQISVDKISDSEFNTNIINSKHDKIDGDTGSVDMNSAIALINRYCGKLPSDTFTRLAPQWSTEVVQLQTATGVRDAYICTLRLPLNCPVKYNIVGHPMPTRVLARRMVALQACRILHKSGELDNQLMPIGKENFKAAELETNVLGSGYSDNGESNESARPGTTKRRQYYYKRTALAFTDCQPIVDTRDEDINSIDTSVPKTAGNEVKTGPKRNMLYAIVSKLWCALPERYNTRGRRLHAPQHARQAIGILMARGEPDNLQIPAFPVYTRSGEVRVSVEYVPDADVRVSPRRGRLIRRFMRFVFSAVLRVRRRGMRLHSVGSTHNNYYIVPTVKTTREDGSTKIDVDWAFLELIYQHTEEQKQSDLEKPNVWQNEEEEHEAPEVEKKAGGEAEKKTGGVLENPLLKAGETFVFDPELYKEAVVTPWYRNQDQPQFFLVAEICGNLTPDSAFPSASHTSFRKYYSTKYNVTLSQPDQPLLDVDHTSARLNLLTPRYVNRKGVALPVSSERTRRAKRDRLDQKQILVPELCKVHPFAAPLWFATVALPCVLYRINALLIADEIRRAVAIDVGLGIPKIDESTCPGFSWPALDFGWSLAEVLNADFEKSDRKRDEDDAESKELIDTEDNDNQMVERDGEHTEEVREKTINDILHEKETESGFEIGTWSNDMASSIPPEVDDYLEPLPSNLTFCTSASGGANWCDPIETPKSQFNPTRVYSMAASDCSYLSSDFDTDDSDLDSDGSDDDTDTSGFYSGRNSNGMGVRITYKTAREAEAVDEPRGPSRPAPRSDPAEDDKDALLHRLLITTGHAPTERIMKYRAAVETHKQDIVSQGHLIRHDEGVGEILPEPSKDHQPQVSKDHTNIDEIFPYGADELEVTGGQISLQSIERNKRVLLSKLKMSMPEEKIKKLSCFSMKDVDIDSPTYVNEKIANVGFDQSSNYKERIQNWGPNEFRPYYEDCKGQNRKEFDFDYQPNLQGHPGPSPSVILQALTMSNANDGINLERLETIGDSYLKFAITAYLYCAHPTVHEGKLSHMRSKQVSNLNLYRLGRNKRLGARMIASKFEPHDNWLPPCHKPPQTLHPRTAAESQNQGVHSPDTPVESSAPGCFIPYNLITQHSIPDKSIADCVEALIGAYLLECGPRGALLFMSWLGIRVLPRHDIPLPTDHPYVKAANHTDRQKSPPPSPTREPVETTTDSSESESEDYEAPQLEDRSLESWSWPGRAVGSLRPYRAAGGRWVQPIFGELKAPPSPLLKYIENPEGELEQMLSGYEALERTLQYRFKDRSLLLQALTHASHHKNRLTDCYQRLEFLGDAILDYLITRHLYEDPRRHSPGALTDLRSALVNNTIFATLAARHGFHKYFRHMSPGLNEVLTKYVKIQEENGHSISEEHYLIQEDEMDQAEDVEVPKALGDLFESIAGAIFLDSGMSLGAVWKSYVNLMGAELEAFSAAAPKSPVRELLEAEPDTAKFGKPERLADGRRVRVCVEVFGRGQFKGIGRNYRIAKGTAARCALRHLRIHRSH